MITKEKSHLKVSEHPLHGNWMYEEAYVFFVYHFYFFLILGKRLDHIAGCLIGFACSIAFKKGYEGFVSLLPKTQLIPFYQEKYDFRPYGRLLALEHERSKQVIDQYLKHE